ncbi:MAG: 6,7-dimethyl-8-ribityllumazine synthase [Nannocystaceae bacterium]
MPRGCAWASWSAASTASSPSPCSHAAIDTLVRHGAAAQGRHGRARARGVGRSPRLPRRYCERDDVDAVIALGCLMRGTIHFDLIAGEVTKALGALARGRVPVAFGVLTTDSLEQSIHRAGAKAGNKSAEAAMAAIEQARVLASLRPPARARGTRR